uniref:Uncharacterized protein n=1 Tax=Heterorhabditis bacteriophora TaxID=37862 RepID=A0A1I7WXU2_HETBA
MMLNGCGSVDVLQIIAELQKVVVCLKEKDKNKISNITMENSPADSEERCNQNRQLRDLDNENRQLRDMYEDAQWTLHLIMEQHRTNVKRLCDDNRSQTVTPNEISLEKESDDRRAFLYEQFIELAVGFNEVMKKESERSGNNLEKIDLLLTENLILRELLEGDYRNADTKTLLERVEQKASISALNKSVIHRSPVKLEMKADCMIYQIHEINCH